MILFVDDEPGAMLPWTEKLREEFGDDGVLVARGAGEALRAARDHAGTIDLLVVDLQMPVEGDLSAAEAEFGQLTGRVLRRALRSALPSAPAVFLTNRLDEPLLLSLREGGDLAYRKRHQRPTQLVETIRALRAKYPRMASVEGGSTAAPRTTSAQG